MDAPAQGCGGQSLCVPSSMVGITSMCTATGLRPIHITSCSIGGSIILTTLATGRHLIVYKPPSPNTHAWLGHLLSSQLALHATRSHGLSFLQVLTTCQDPGPLTESSRLLAAACHVQASGVQTTMGKTSSRWLDTLRAIVPTILVASKLSQGLVIANHRSAFVQFNIFLFNTWSASLPGWAHVAFMLLTTPRYTLPTTHYCLHCMQRAAWTSLRFADMLEHAFLRDRWAWCLFLVVWLRQAEAHVIHCNVRINCEARSKRSIKEGYYRTWRRLG